MTKTRNLSDLLDSNGDVKSTALDNVPASNDASALTTGTLDNARLSAVPNSALANSSITINGSATSLGGSATINTDLVNDTTPQLGGALDVNGHSISFGDNEKARFGNADDMEIYHDGSNSWVKDNGTGVLALASNGNGIGLYNADGTKPMVFGTINSHTKLYHDGSEKLSTTSTGATVTGTLTATAFSGDGSGLTNVPAGVSNVNTVRVTSSGTYTPTSGTKFFTVYACGGGGGSGFLNPINGRFQVVSGGNGGCTTVKTYTATEMGSTASVTIGSGGSGGNGANNHGGTGGDTTFTPNGTGSAITGKGGYGSYSWSFSSNGIGLPRHEHQSTSLQNGDYVIFGEFGNSGDLGNTSFFAGTDDGYIIGGAGGNSAFGAGANFTKQRSSSFVHANSASANSGGGASGCISKSNSATVNSGSGGSGYVIIQEYA